jgi:hypothetical protein
LGVLRAVLNSQFSDRLALNGLVGGIVAPYHKSVMAFPIKVCSLCGEEFELKPDKPGFANRCPECSTEDTTAKASQRPMDAEERKSLSEANEARRRAMRDLLYRKDG